MNVGGAQVGVRSQFLQHLQCLAIEAFPVL